MTFFERLDEALINGSPLDASDTEHLKTLAESGNRRFTRAYADILTTNVIDVNSDKAYSELEHLVQKYTDDPIMPAMLAWAKINHTGFNDLAQYFAEHPENVLVAGIYANACANRFDYDLSDGAMLLELERLLRDYGAAYRDYGDELDCDFAPYWHNWLDHCFTRAIAAAAVDDVENSDLQRLLEHYAIFTRNADCCDAAIYQSIEQQLLSNLAQLYGRNGDYAGAKKAIDRLREYSKEDEEAISSLTDAIYNLATQCAEDDVKRYGVQLKAMAGELEVLAARTDDIHNHTRYVMALYNVSNELENACIDHIPMWDLLYSYSMAHTIQADMAEHIATEEMSLIGAANNVRNARKHWERVKAMYNVYGENMVDQLAAANYNLLIVALPHGDVNLAEEMLQELISLADEYADDEENLNPITLRVAKGAIMLATKYAKMNDIDHEHTVYSRVAPRLMCFADDPEISERLTKMALNLCIDLAEAKRDSQARTIYEELVKLQFSEESAKRIKKIEGLLS